MTIRALVARFLEKCRRRRPLSAEGFYAQLKEVDRLERISACELISLGLRNFKECSFGQEAVLMELFRRIDPEWTTRCKKEIDSW